MNLVARFVIMFVTGFSCASNPPKIKPFHFTKQLQIGEREQVFCTVKSGDPPFTFKWMKDNTDIERFRDIVLSVDTLNGFSSMLVRSVQPENIGNYTCIVTNSAGTDNYTALLVVKGEDLPKVRPFHFSSDVKIGQRERAMCVVIQGDLPITFKWNKNGIELREGKEMTVNVVDEYTSLLTINEVVMDSIGNYTCMVTNTVGSDSYTAALVMKVPPRWGKEPTDVAATLGSRLTIDCSASGYPQPQITWDKLTDRNEHHLPVGSDNQRTLSSNGSLTFMRLDESDEGIYVCQAFNGIGNGLQKKIRLTVHVAPRVKDEYTVVTVRKGFPAQLKCEVIGEPPITITWKKEETTIAGEKGSRLETLHENTVTGAVSEALVYDSQQNDSGIYTCHVHSQFGDHKGKIQLVVLEPPNPPRGIKVTETTSRTARLTWQAPSGSADSPVVTYIVRYWREEESRSQLHQLNFRATSTSSNLKDLHPGTSYAVQLLAENDVGASIPSRLVRFRTTEEAPVGSPTDVSVEPLGSRTLKVTWKPPLSHHWNGIIKGYYVGHKESDSTQPYYYQTVDWREVIPESLTIAGLQKAKAYSVVVKAFNSAGSGPASHPVEAYSLDGDPPPPPAISVSHVTSSSAQLNWENPQAVSPTIRQYLLEFRGDNKEWIQLHVPNNRKLFVLNGLDSSRRYQLRLAAYNKHGKGDFAIIGFTTAHKELSTPLEKTATATPFYLRPYVIIPVAASVVVIVTTVATAWVCYKRMTLREKTQLMLTQQYGGSIAGARASLHSRNGYSDITSYSPPPNTRYPPGGVAVPEDDAYDAPWDMSGSRDPRDGGSYTRLKNHTPNGPGVSTGNERPLTSEGRI